MSSEPAGEGRERVERQERCMRRQKDKEKVNARPLEHPLCFFTRCVSFFSVKERMCMQSLSHANTP